MNITELKEKIGEKPKTRPVPNMNDVPNGHPAKTMAAENDALLKSVENIEKNLQSSWNETVKEFNKLLEIERHYGKKEKLFMAVLYHRGVTGPSGGMWDADDEIKNEIRAIAKELKDNEDENLRNRIENVLKRVKLMVRAETESFLPTSFRFFTDTDWLEIYRDSFEIGAAFTENIALWEEGEKFRNAPKKTESLENNKLTFQTGELTLKELKAIMKFLPVDITFIDKDETLKFFFNERHTFDRPELIIGKSVYGCHPSKIFAAVEKMMEDFKSKKRRCVKQIQMIASRPTAVDYIAVYDEEDEYIGTVEIVEDYSRAFEYFKLKEKKKKINPCNI